MRDAIDAVRGLMPVLDRQEGGEDLKPLRDAVSQLQLEYAKLAQASGEVPSASAPAAAPDAAAEPSEGRGPAQSSGRLWVPGS